MAGVSAGYMESIDLAPESGSSQPRSNTKPPKPKYRSSNGLTTSSGKVYKVIEKVERMNRARSHSRGGRSNSTSRTKNCIDRSIETDRMMDTKSSELGGVLTKRSSSKQRPESRGPMAFLSRGRSSSRQSSKDDASTSGSKVHRSRSRLGKGLMKKMRSLSRIRKPSNDNEPRGRSSSRGRDRGNEYSERPVSRGRRCDFVGGANSEMPPRPGARRPRVNDQEDMTPRDDHNKEHDMHANLPPTGQETIEKDIAPGSSSCSSSSSSSEDEDVSNEDDDSEHRDENAEIGDKKNQHKSEPTSLADSNSESDDEEEDPDELTANDVMKLDSKNTKMHVACLLHYPSKQVVCELKLDNSSTFKANSAGELPLHYAMMDKKGVNDEVLLTLLQLNPDAVQYPNAHRSLPIHLACMSGGGNKDAVRALLSICPDSVMVRSKYPIPFEQDMLDNINNTKPDAEKKEVAKQQKTTVASGSFLDLFGLGTEAPSPQPTPNTPTRRICVDDELTRGKQMYETGWTPLHLAVLNGAESAVISLIVAANPQCVFVKTNRGRMALDCAQYMVRQHWLYGTDEAEESTVQKTFAAIEILEETAIDYR